MIFIIRKSTSWQIETPNQTNIDENKKHITNIVTKFNCCVTIQEKPLALQKPFHASYLVEGRIAGGFIFYVGHLIVAELIKC